MICKYETFVRYRQQSVCPITAQLLVQPVAFIHGISAQIALLFHRLSIRCNAAALCKLVDGTPFVPLLLHSQNNHSSRLIHLLHYSIQVSLIYSLPIPPSCCIPFASIATAHRGRILFSQCQCASIASHTLIPRTPRHTTPSCPRAHNRLIRNRTAT